MSRKLNNLLFSPFTTANWVISNVEQRTDISGTAQSLFHVWSRHQRGTCTTLFEKKKVTKEWCTQSWCFLIKSTIVAKCYQRGRFTLGHWCPVSHTESPGWSWLFTVVYSFLDSPLRVSQSMLNSFLPGKAGFHLWGSPTSMSLARVYFPLRWRSNFVENVVLEWERWGLRCHLVSPPILCNMLYGGWIWANYHETRTTTSNSRVSFIDFYLVFPTNFRIVFLRHTNTVI